ncbi:hypothetical protein PENTCL1PPCAC_12538, partial [Pristionchus entomophagus]
ISSHSLSFVSPSTCLDIFTTNFLSYFNPLSRLSEEYYVWSLVIEEAFRHGMDEFMVDSYFIDVTRITKNLALRHECKNITHEAIAQVYNNMLEGSTKLRRLSILNFHMDQCFLKLLLLKHIGIEHKEGRFRSNREAIEYHSRKKGLEHTSIFDGCLEIRFKGSIRFYNDGYLARID